MDLFSKLFEATGNNAKRDYPLKEYTTFKIGGPADYFVTPETEEQVLHVINIAKENSIPFFILGKGSNILVPDEGFRGLVINLSDKFNKIESSQERIYAQSGATLTDVSKTALVHSLTGLEFAIGIPGSLGGAVFMNAGAYGGEMKDCIHEVKFIRDNKILTEHRENLEFGYRKSTFQKKNDIVIGAWLQLKKGNYDEIKAVMEELTQKREEKQPLEMPSAGSVFKRPEGYFAGKLIQDSGLRGFKVGNAEVSTKHCGFIVNAGGATAQDVKGLVEEIQKRVKEKFGVELEREIRYL
ncbi:UDP-N-acetylmuramate dehydrogenase [Alkalicella caledoniensis]|uniref:UDP-N-acetylenolpyruvoylglucosamine reductase n=1 Tax=Alkalicella caledoniensis TaxID=2731377 RepID=A0A7G9W770_ALKCA|nr:UDP-N-acetylmuramate dehydrogenase [Alkalicella caledoniensis]QNO14532.1 UDP-N-acetylmuramate dehydrogenase [Alkalicella caledoniensis]